MTPHGDDEVDTLDTTEDNVKTSDNGTTGHTTKIDVDLPLMEQITAKVKS